MSDERYLRLRDVQDAIDSITWSAVDHDGAVGFRAAISQKIAGLDWLAGRAVQDDGRWTVDDLARALEMRTVQQGGSPHITPDNRFYREEAAAILANMPVGAVQDDGLDVERVAKVLHSMFYANRDMTDEDHANATMFVNRYRAAPPLHDPQESERG